jgi:hypothetical protein
MSLQRILVLIVFSTPFLTVAKKKKAATRQMYAGANLSARKAVRW